MKKEDKKSKKRSSLISGIATLSGTMIGAGILGIPYAISRSGFLIGLMFILGLGILSILIHLYIGEIMLRTKENHQLTGYAEKYLGKPGKFLMLFSVIFGLYSALIAYLIGEGESLSYLIFGNIEFSFYFTILFFIFVLFFILIGLDIIKKEISIGVIFFLVLIVLIALLFAPKIDIQNLNYISQNFEDLIFPYGIVFFAMLGYSALPELKQEMKDNKKDIKKAIIIGTLIPILVYILFSFVILGFMGKNTPEIATFSLGMLPIFLGIIGMMNAFIILGMALKDTYVFDLKINKTVSLILSCFIPLLIFLIVYFFKLNSFIAFLELSGAISGGITGILVLFMLINAKKKGDRKPEYEIKLNSWLITFLTIFFILGMLYVLFF